MTHSVTRLRYSHLSESDCTLIANALRVAAEQYNTDAHNFTEAGQSRIAAQFDRQERDARRLAEIFEDVTGIHLERTE